jgi:uncharacterized protein YutE (UPF0331/DUF86 family)
MIEPETIEGIFRNLDIYLDQLRQLAKVPREEFAHDLVRLGAAKYYLQVAVECCIDMANHVIAREGFRAPESYADSFTYWPSRESSSRISSPQRTRWSG